jgi:hypothetical protein
MATPMPGKWGHIPAILDENYWSTYNSDDENARVKYPRLTDTNSGSNLSMSDFWMFNGGYLRMKNVSLGYNIPSKLTEIVSINKIRIYISGNDLFCLSRYPDGWDPERGDSSYPITTSVLFGINVNF